jgi:hypothetical protein
LNKQNNKTKKFTKTYDTQALVFYPAVFFIYIFSLFSADKSGSHDIAENKLLKETLFINNTSSAVIVYLYLVSVLINFHSLICDRKMINYYIIHSKLCRCFGDLVFQVGELWPQNYHNCHHWLGSNPYTQFKTPN